VALDGFLRGVATDVCLREARRPDLAVALAGDDPDWLLDLAAELDRTAAAAGPDSPTALAARSARARGTDRLKARCDHPDATAGDHVRLASLYDEQGNPAAAVDAWRRALTHDLHQADWRIRLARSLAAAGRRDEARREAQTCLRLRPGMAGAEELVDSLSRDGPDTRPGE
jgi:tetratricopeptide (TPR) repeat protein